MNFFLFLQSHFRVIVLDGISVYLIHITQQENAGKWDVGKFIRTLSALYSDIDYLTITQGSL